MLLGSTRLARDLDATRLKFNLTSAGGTDEGRSAPEGGPDDI
jgi:hypothetical protein